MTYGVASQLLAAGHSLGRPRRPATIPKADTIESLLLRLPIRPSSGVSINHWSGLAFSLPESGANMAQRGNFAGFA
jgi:hypothetical protein